MLERIRRIPGETLEQQTYRKDFRANLEHIKDVFWKLERRQTFQELDDPSYDALVQGRWDDSVRLLEDSRPQTIEYFQRVAKIGFVSRRIRVVEYPITPYTQWELTYFKMRVEYGAEIRMLDAANLGSLEADGPFAEVVVLGTGVMYEIIYTDAGAPNGARRITDPTVIRACRTQMATLWEQAEDFLPFFEREIAPLPPPVPDHVEG